LVVADQSNTIIIRPGKCWSIKDRTAECFTSSDFCRNTSKTISHPDRHFSDISQLHEGVAFHFVRTIPAAENGAPQNMRAIVVLGPNGQVNSVTYFKFD
jgi:hypothetical protein